MSSPQVLDRAAVDERTRSRTAPTPVATEWERAYQRFETPHEEVREFLRRLRWLGVDQFSRYAEVVELFCGRGNGLIALAQLGFTRLEGVDLSPTLLADYQGDARVIVADCRALPLDDQSKDLLIVQGGLHHLPELPDDLLQVLREAHRVLRSGGHLAVVEPWMTPFLALVHRACTHPSTRRLSPRLDALATMIEHERETYERWLAHPAAITASIERFFEPVRRKVGWGKLWFAGRKRRVPLTAS